MITIEQAKEARRVDCDCGGKRGHPCISGQGAPLPDTRTHLRRYRKATGQPGKKPSSKGRGRPRKAAP